MPLFSGLALLVLPRRLMPRPREMNVPAPAASAARRAIPLPRAGEVVKLLAGILVVHHRPHRHAEDHVFARFPVAARAFSMPAAVRAELAVIAVPQQRVVALR